MISRCIHSDIYEKTRTSHLVGGCIMCLTPLRVEGSGNFDFGLLFFKMMMRTRYRFWGYTFNFQNVDMNLNLFFVNFFFNFCVIFCYFFWKIHQVQNVILYRWPKDGQNEICLLVRNSCKFEYIISDTVQSHFDKIFSKKFYHFCLGDLWSQQYPEN